MNSTLAVTFNKEKDTEFTADFLTTEPHIDVEFSTEDPIKVETELRVEDHSFETTYGEILQIPTGGEGSPLPPVNDSDNGKVLTVKDGRWQADRLAVDETLSYENGVLSVNRAHEPDPDNTLPITAAAVASTVGNIEILLQTI